MAAEVPQPKEDDRGSTCRCFKLLFSCEPISIVALVSLLIYFVLGAVFYTAVEGWRIGDALYFCVVVMTTVGYGDFLPTTDGSKIFTAFFVLYALVIAAFALSHIFSTVQNIAQEALSKDRQQSDGLFDQEAKRRLRRNSFIKTTVYFWVCLLVFTVVFGATMDWEGAGFEGNAYVNGFYFTMISLTTVGFGDISPPSTSEIHMFLTVLLMIFGIPIFGSALSSMTEYLFGESQDAVKLSLVRNGLNACKFGAMQEFAEQIQSSGQQNQGADDKISRFEFFAFMLVENGVIDIKVVQDAVRNFNELDVDGSGVLTIEDLVNKKATLAVKPCGQASGATAMGKVCPEEMVLASASERYAKAELME